MVGFLGSIRSTQVNAMAPDVEKTGKPMMFGGTDPTLTHSGYKWLFRCRPNDSYSGRVIAQFGDDTLKKKEWAIVHSTDAFGTGGKSAMTDALGKLGLTPELIQGYSNQQADFTPVVLAVKQSGADILVQLLHLRARCRASSPASCASSACRSPGSARPRSPRSVTIGLAKNALWGTYGVADFRKDANDEAKALNVAYRNKFGGEPDSGWTYDAVNILALAINTAKTTEPAKIRDAIIATQGLQGHRGRIQLRRQRRRPARLQHRQRTTRATPPSTSTSSFLPDHSA